MNISVPPPRIIWPPAAFPALSAAAASPDGTDVQPHGTASPTSPSRCSCSAGPPGKLILQGPAPESPLLESFHQPHPSPRQFIASFPMTSPRALQSGSRAEPDLV